MKLMAKKLSRAFRHGLLFAAFSCFRAWVAMTPRPVALWVGGGLADLAYALGGRVRSEASSRIARVLNLDSKQSSRICRRMYCHFGWDLIDLMIWGGWRRRRLHTVIRVEGWEHLERALAAGKGVVGLTAHMSLWELFGGYVASRLGGIAVLAHPAYDENFNRVLVNYRARMGVRTFYRQEPASVPLAWLREGRFLGVLADQDIPDMPSEIIDFLGFPARTPIGPALLARRSGAPLIPMYIVREAGQKYRVIIEPPLVPSAAPAIKTALREDTVAWSARVAAWVRSHPEQWVWVHDRWRF